MSQTSPALPTSEKKLADASSKNTWICPEFKVSGVFSSHMVLQREQPITVWGFSTAVGSTVKGEFMGEGSFTTVGEDNVWSLRFLPHLCVYEGQTMKIYDDLGHEVIFEDILVGDVWFIGGQSNAELNLAPCMTLTPSIDFYDGDNFRLFSQTQAFVYTHQEYCEAPQPDVINPEWCWKRPDKAASLSFSAMGYYFGREMIKKTDVPIGIVMMCAGGACIRELLPEDVAHEIGYNYGANVREAGYYNTLIHPFLKLPFKGMMYFQGESEGGDPNLAQRYDLELALLVADERKRFGRDFPFYNIQISSYRSEGAQFFPWLDVIRVKQVDALKLIPNSTLTVSMDLGSPEDYEDWAHSPRKLEVGERLAALILAREYGVGRETEVSSPMPVSARLSSDKTRITVDFTNVSAGLCVSGLDPVGSLDKSVQGFSVGARDSQTPVTATISSRCAVTVDVPEGVDASQINYAYFPIVTPENADLRGGNNLPAPAFSLKVTE